MTAAGRRHVEPTATASALSVTLVFFFWLFLHVGCNNGIRYFDDVVTALAALSACVACLLAGKRRSGSERRFWVLLGLALGTWTFAEAIRGVCELVLRVAVPVPSWARPAMPAKLCVPLPKSRLRPLSSR